MRACVVVPLFVAVVATGCSKPESPSSASASASASASSPIDRAVGKLGGLNGLWKNGGGMVVLLRHEGEKVGWWSRVYRERRDY